jgi:hypothetical protein
MMRDIGGSMISMMVYADAPAPNFMRVVSEVDRQLERDIDEDYQLTLASDSVAWFDFGDRRLLVGLSDAFADDGASCLVVAVAANPEMDVVASLDNDRARLSGLCGQVIAALHRFCPTSSLLCQRSELPLDADFLDAFFGIDLMAAGTSLARDTMPQRPRDDAKPLRARAEPQPELAQRITAHAFNCSVLAVSVPVGAALMAHSFVRGEDLRLSSRAVALTGAAVGLQQIAGTAALSLLF